MAFKRAISRLMLGLLLSMAAMAGSAAYWAVTGDLSLMRRDDNPRLMEAEAAIRRGAIYSRDDVLLAESVVNPDSDRVSRLYHEPAFYSVLGYYSLRYGTGGAEAAFNAILRGDTLTDDVSRHFEQNFLHRPQTGSDIRLTLNAAVQDALTTAMGNHQGAAVLMSVPRGEVLAMVSLPDFDPNELDTQWASLIEDEGNPFFNRVLQGRYQPGTALLTPLMAQALLTNSDLSQVYPDAAAPVPVEDVVLSCAIMPDEQALTLTQAYSYACPAPFQLLAAELGERSISSIFADFRLNSAPRLNGFVAQDDALNSANTISAASGLSATALGQSDLTVSPLRMAAIAAAIINDGNAPVPQALSATRTPKSQSWQNAITAPGTEAIMTTATARRLRELMISSVTNGGLGVIAQDGISIGGQAAMAYAGSNAQTWFIGFATSEAGPRTAIAVVLEDSRDALDAAQIGASALAVAQTTDIRVNSTTTPE